MADFHAADLWVAVIPETSQVGPAMEAAGKEAKGKFGEAVKDIGKSIRDDFDKVGTHAKDAFSKAGKTAGEVFSSEIGKELSNTAAKEIGKALGEAVRELPAVRRGVELFQEWGDAAKVGAGAIQGVADAMHSAKAGDFSTALGGIDKTLRSLEPVADKFGVDLKGLGATDATKSLGELNTIAGGLSTKLGDAKGAVDRLGQSGGGLNGLIGKLGEVGIIASTVIGSLDEIKQGDDWLEKKIPLYKDLDEAYKNGPLKAFKGLFNDAPATASPPAYPGGLPQGVQNLILPPGGALAQPSTGPGSLFGSVPKSWPQTLPTPYGPSFAPPDMPGLEPPPRASIGGAGHSGGSGGGLNLSIIPVAAQKYANDCIDASARIILSHAGINMTEDQLEGVIAPGGTIESQAAGLNRLYPAGRFTAMQGSGGSPAAMFNAIKASIDSGTGSILNVAPGSSIAGKPFSEGHFIAATGYNPDGTINLSDTARGTQYSVSAADAFQATRGRGIVAGTGSGPFPTGGGAGGGGAGGQIPTGAEHDPIYTMQGSGGGGSGGSTSESQGEQLGQGLGKGFLQLFGLDGSVFGGKSPTDWGAVKLGSGLLNWGMGKFGAPGGGAAAGAGGGGGGGGLGGLLGMIPGPGPGISAAAGPAGGSLSIPAHSGGDGAKMIHNDNRISVQGFANPTDWVTPAQFSNNSSAGNPGTRYAGAQTSLPIGPQP